MVRVDPDRMAAFGADLVTTSGTTRSVAREVAESLVSAELRGHTSHGLLRIPFYLELVDEGAIDPTAEPSVTHEGSATIAVEGNRAFGQRVGRFTLDRASAKAEEYGVAVAGIRRSAHLGRIGEWAERAAEAGLCFASWVKSRTFIVAPPGSSERVLSTNPVTWGVPSYDALPFPIVLDMATSQVAHGKIRDRAAQGRAVPVEWTVGPEGGPITDASAFEEGIGAQLPLGGRTAGYKGFGLATMVELFAGVIGDAAVGGEHDQPRGTNDAAFVLIDPTRFAPREQIEARIAALAAYIRNVDYRDTIDTGAAMSGDHFLLPGEAEHLREREAREAGLDVADAIARSLYDLARERGVADAAPAAITTLAN